MKVEWYYLIDEKTVGPVAVEEIRKRLAGAKSPVMVWHEGMRDWQDARKLSEFAHSKGRAGGMPSSKDKPVGKKVVLITGATSGIGKACADYLGGTGWRVFGTGRSLTSSAAPGKGVEMLSMDVDDETSVKTAVEQVMARAGRLDAVVNNAGYSLMGAVEDTTIEEAKAQFETNFFGALRVCRAALPALRASGGGCIINISSLAGVVGLPYSGLYSASKFALEGVSESLRLEVRPFGVNVVLVEPGDFKTQTTAKRRVAASSHSSLYKDVFEKFKRKQDHDEINGPTPEPVAKLVGHILKQRRPKTRYSVGRLDQRIVVPLKRALPQRVFEWLFGLVMGL